MTTTLHEQQQQKQQQMLKNISWWGGHNVMTCWIPRTLPSDTEWVVTLYWSSVVNENAYIRFFIVCGLLFAMTSMCTMQSQLYCCMASFRPI